MADVEIYPKGATVEDMAKASMVRSLWISWDRAYTEVQRERIRTELTTIYDDRKFWERQLELWQLYLPNPPVIERFAKKDIDALQKQAAKRIVELQLLLAGFGENPPDPFELPRYDPLPHGPWAD